MVLFLLTMAVVAILMALMAVGVIFKGRCLRGSCGGQAIYDSDGELMNCAHCPVRKEEEAKLQSGQ